MCRPSLLPLSLLHTYSYEIYLSRDDFDSEGKYILTQWHGTADPTLLQDEYGCVAQVRSTDIHRLCSEGYCNQGEVLVDTIRGLFVMNRCNGVPFHISGMIHDRSGIYMGIRYEQGGYPPLTMALQSGYFIITARSDERNFKAKGGCSKGLHSVKCSNYPRQHVWLCLFPIKIMNILS